MASYYVKKIKKSKKLKSLVLKDIHMSFPCRCQSQSLDSVSELRHVLFQVVSLELCSGLPDGEQVPGCM